MDLPPPIPQPKTMFIPLDPERYVKPRLTLFHVKRKPTIFTDINLSIPVDELNMHPELYNPPPNASIICKSVVNLTFKEIELSDKDRELIEEKPLKKTPHKTAPEGKLPKPLGLERELSRASNHSNTKAKSRPAEHHKKSDQPVTPSNAKKKEENKKLPIEEYLKKSFEIAKSYKPESKHPTKEGVYCEEVYDILPDLQNIINKLFVVKTEVSTETLRSRENIMRFDTDVDKKPILSIYSHKALFETETQDQMEKELTKRKKENDKGIEEEVESDENLDNKEMSLEIAHDPVLKKIENFEHIGNYVYSIPKPIGTAKRDLLLNLNKSDRKAYIYPTQPIIIKKKKVLFTNKTLYKDEEGEEEKKPQEAKKTIKFIKKEEDKEDLLLKKRTYKEMHLENVKTPYYQRNKEALENYKEEENEEELEEIKKKFIKEEVEEEAAIDEEKEEEELGVGEGEMEEEEEERSKGAISQEVDEGEARYKEDDQEEEKQFEEEEEEKSVPEAKAKSKGDKEESENEAVQELAELFEESEDEDDS